jgi:hypothetical protein
LIVLAPAGAPLALGRSSQALARPDDDKRVSEKLTPFPSLP